MNVLNSAYAKLVAVFGLFLWSLQASALTCTNTGPTSPCTLAQGISYSDAIEGIAVIATALVLFGIFCFAASKIYSAARGRIH